MLLADLSFNKDVFPVLWPVLLAAIGLLGYFQRKNNEIQKKNNEILELKLTHQSKDIADAKIDRKEIKEQHQELIKTLTILTTEMKDNKLEIQKNESLLIEQNGLLKDQNRAFEANEKTKDELIKYQKGQFKTITESFTKTMESIMSENSPIMYSIAKKIEKDVTQNLKTA